MLSSPATQVLPAAPPVPTEGDIARISAIPQPVLRNLQITNCYCDLSAAFAVRTGMAANWCTFATWASRQAGQTIRGEDLHRTIELALRREPGILGLLDRILDHSRKLGSREVHARLHEFALTKIIRSATARAADAVARGNRKVFEEIGHEFARFIATCLQDVVYTEETITGFCSALKKGNPPEGQDYLCRAFRRYYTAFFETDEKKKDELLYLANLEIGFHEQTRLQPEIAESLNAAIVDPQPVIDHLFASLQHRATPWGNILLYFHKFTGRTSLLMKGVENLVASAERHIRKAITSHMMTLMLPPDRCLHLGHDLFDPFPECLQRLSSPDLKSLLEEVDPTPNSLLASGASDWADLKERLHYIADLFRCYHKTKDLFNPAFTKEQLAILRMGHVPGGRL